MDMPINEVEELVTHCKKVIFSILDGGDLEGKLCLDALKVCIDGGFSRELIAGELAIDGVEALSLYMWLKINKFARLDSENGQYVMAINDQILSDCYREHKERREAIEGIFIVLNFVLKSKINEVAGALDNSSLKNSDIVTDLVEETAEYKVFVNEAERIAEEMTIEYKSKLGYCHRFWEAKKWVLRNRFNIIWRSPAELNPHIHFD